MLTMGKRTYKLTGISDILGATAANANIRSDFLAGRAETPEIAQNIIDENELIEPHEDESITVFLRHPDTHSVCFRQHVLKGFFKEALISCKTDIKISQPKSKADRYLFIEPEFIPLKRDGADIEKEDDIFERPARVEIMRGERSALLASERVNAPWIMEFTVTILKNEKTKTSPALDFEALETALDYGQLRGLGQGRNMGFGRFTWSVQDEA